MVFVSKYIVQMVISGDRLGVAVGSFWRRGQTNLQ